MNYAARSAETIAVGTVSNDKLIAKFSSRGPTIDIAAPDENILSTYP